MKKSDIQKTRDRLNDVKTTLSILEEQISILENKRSYLSKRIELEEEISDLELNENKYKVDSNDILISDIQNDIQNKLKDKEVKLLELIIVNEKK